MKAAFFDVDGTLVRSNIVMYYYRWRLHNLKGLRRKAWAAIWQSNWQSRGSSRASVRERLQPIRVVRRTSRQARLMGTYS